MTIPLTILLMESFIHISGRQSAFCCLDRYPRQNLLHCIGIFSSFSNFIQVFFIKSMSVFFLGFRENATFSSFRMLTAIKGFLPSLCCFEGLSSLLQPSLLTFPWCLCSPRPTCSLMSPPPQSGHCSLHPLSPPRL